MSEKLLDTMKIYENDIGYSLREYIDFYLNVLNEETQQSYSVKEIIKYLVGNECIELDDKLINELVETYGVNKEELEKIKNRDTVLKGNENGMILDGYTQNDNEQENLVQEKSELQQELEEKITEILNSVGRTNLQSNIFAEVNALFNIIEDRSNTSNTIPQKHKNDFNVVIKDNQGNIIQYFNTIDSACRPAGKKPLAEEKIQEIKETVFIYLVKRCLDMRNTKKNTDLKLINIDKLKHKKFLGYLAKNCISIENTSKKGKELADFCKIYALNEKLEKHNIKVERFKNSNSGTKFVYKITQNETTFDVQEDKKLNVFDCIKQKHNIQETETAKFTILSQISGAITDLTVRTGIEGGQSL